MVKVFYVNYMPSGQIIFYTSVARQNLGLTYFFHTTILFYSAYFKFKL